MLIEELQTKIIATIAIFVVSAVYALIRKWKSNDDMAGVGFMGWGFFGILIVWIG